MNQRLIYLLFSIFLPLSVFAQEITLDLNEFNIHELTENEIESGSKLLRSNSRILLPKELAQPLTFLRPKEDSLSLRVKYYFLKQDSMLHSALYSWSAISTGKLGGNNPRGPKFIKNMIRRYTEYSSMIDLSLNGESSDEIKYDIDLINSSEGLILEKNWFADDGRSCRLKLKLKNKYEERGLYITYPTIHELDLYVWNTGQRSKTTISPNISKENNEKLKDSALIFLTCLEENQYQEAKNMLAEEVKSSFTDQQLISLKELIINRKSIDLEYTSNEIAKNTFYSTLMFRGLSLENDLGFRIRFIFNASGQILDIRWGK